MHMLSRRAALRGSMLAAGALAARRAAAEGAGAHRIGAFVPLSGAAASLGQSVLLGLQIATDLINAEGGVQGRKLELVVKDTRSSPVGAVEAVREILGDNIKLVLGGVPTFEVMSALPLVRDANAFYVTLGASTSAINHEAFDRHMFRPTDDDYEETKALAQLALDRYPSVNNWISVMFDFAASRDSVNVFQALMRDAYAAAGKPVSFAEPLYLKFDITDARQQLAQLMASPAQGIYQILYGQGGVTLYQQARAFDLGSKFKVIFDRGDEYNLARALKSNLPENLWVMSFWYPGAYSSVPLSNQVFAEYQKRSNGDKFPPSFVYSGTVAVQTAAAALAATGGSEDTDALIAALEGGLKISTVKGSMYYRREDHQAVADVNFVLQAPSSEEPGFKVADFVKYDGARLLEPPTPGVALKF